MFNVTKEAALWHVAATCCSSHAPHVFLSFQGDRIEILGKKAPPRQGRMALPVILYSQDIDVRYYRDQLGRPSSDSSTRGCITATAPASCAEAQHQPDRRCILERPRIPYFAESGLILHTEVRTEMALERVTHFALVSCWVWLAQDGQSWSRLCRGAGETYVRGFDRW